jgi:hypothetical protein
MEVEGLAAVLVLEVVLEVVLGLVIGLVMELTMELELKLKLGLELRLGLEAMTVGGDEVAFPLLHLRRLETELTRALERGLVLGTRLVLRLEVGVGVVDNDESLTLLHFRRLETGPPGELTLLLLVLVVVEEGIAEYSVG